MTLQTPRTDPDNNGHGWLMVEPAASDAPDCCPPCPSAQDPETRVTRHTVAHDPTPPRSVTTLCSTLESGRYVHEPIDVDSRPRNHTDRRRLR